MKLLTIPHYVLGNITNSFFSRLTCFLPENCKPVYLLCQAKLLSQLTTIITIYHKKNFFCKLTLSRSSGEIHFLKLLCFSIYGLMLCKMYQNVSGPILKYWKNFNACSAALGTKYETRHTSLFRQKLGSRSRFSRPLIIIIFSTKDFLTITIVLPFIMQSTRSPI